MTNFQGLKCWYCGNDADTKDHVIALNRAFATRKMRKREKRKVMDAFGRNSIPACGRCNSLKATMTIEEFRAAILNVAPARLHDPKTAKLQRGLLDLRVVLLPFGLAFYGERSPDAVFPVTGQSRPFHYKWKQRASRNDGNEAIRIEECAKMGPYAETLAGLMRGR